MKKGISIEFDYKDDGYGISKAKGTLTLDEIKDAISDYGDAGRFLLMFDTEPDEGQFLEWVENGGDYVKVYSLDTVERMFKK